MKLNEQTKQRVKKLFPEIEEVSDEQLEELRKIVHSHDHNTARQSWMQSE